MSRLPPGSILLAYQALGRLATGAMDKACARPERGPGIEKGNDMQPYELTTVKVAECALDPSDVFERQVPARMDNSPCVARAAEHAR
jgi:hypothetical protein